MRAFTDIAAAAEHVQVLIIGDVMIDRYMHGRVSRISPEAPVPVVEWHRTEDRLGGAANVALNLKALGAQAILCSVIGTDSDGQAFRALLSDNQLTAEGLVGTANRRTTVKTRVMAGTQHMLRIDSEQTDDLDSPLEDKLLEHFQDIINRKKIDIIILQDYNKGVLTARVIETVMAQAQSAGIMTAIDPKHKHFLSYRGATLFKPNLKEIRDAVPFDVAPKEASLDAAAAYLRQHLHNKHTMITLSEKGLFLSQNTEGGCIYPTQERHIADVSGAGDTVISVASVGLAIGLSHPEIALLSNIAGGQVCEIPGVVPVDRERLGREYDTIKNNYK